MMPADTPRDSNQPSASFEAALEALLVSAFANGNRVEGEWEVETPLAATPNWTVAVQAVYSDDEPAYDPDLIE